MLIFRTPLTSSFALLALNWLRASLPSKAYKHMPSHLLHAWGIPKKRVSQIGIFLLLFTSFAVFCFLHFLEAQRVGEGVKLWPYAEGAIIIITTVSFLVLIFLSVVSVFFLYLGSISLGPVQRHKAGGKTKGGGAIKKA